VNPTTVLLVEPRPLARVAIAESLVEDHGIHVRSTADDVSSALLQAARVKADVVVVSTTLEHPLSSLCQQLRELDPAPRVLLADGQPDEEALMRAIEAGADGYVSGAHGVAGLAAAIRAIARGESVVPAVMLGPLLKRLIRRQREAARAAERLVNLTPREREVLALLVEGLGQEQIAAQLVISPATARTHLQRVLRKLDVRSRAEAVELVAGTGLADRLERMVERSAS
jgi:DNA-binding NarL/FixJ family response regulator